MNDRTPCEACGANRGVSTHEDGSTYCFACERTTPATDREKTAVEKNTTWEAGYYSVIKSRCINEETCTKYGYQVGRRGDQWFQIANYRDDKGTLVAQKLRYDNPKSFTIVGEGRKMPLFGQHLFRSGGKTLTITEGELDALSIAQAFDCKFPIVSVPNGATDAKKAIERSLEWINSFERVVLCFDTDKPGREATEECARLLPPGKVRVMHLQEKDANEVLCKHGTQALVTAFYEAKDWRPDGIIPGSELTRERLKQAVATGYKLGLPKFDDATFGLRKGELTVVTAGSGIGKSTWLREIGYHLHQTHNLRIGNVFLEENVNKTGQGYVAIHNDKPLKIVRSDPTVLSDDLWDEALAKVVHPRMWFYDHFGSLDSSHLLSKMRFLAAVERVDFTILDHISIVHSGTSSDEGERKDIDIFMSSLRSLVEETGMGVLAVVHIKRKSGEKSPNEGGRVHLTDLRGAASLEQYSDNVYALERNQQAEKSADKHRSTIRVLKCRETGETGEADELDYNVQTGRLLLASNFTEYDASKVKEHAPEEATF